MGSDLLRVEANERIDLTDFQHLSDAGLQANVRQLAGNFVTNPAGQRSWILEGFAMTNPSGQQLQVDKGRAILGQREGAETYFGEVTVEGDASKIIDMSLLSIATYNVYVRFEYTDGDAGSRIFWNPAGTGSELAQTVATRRLANWSIRVETSSPGAEWLKIGTADNTGPGLVIVDQRPFYFEGDPDATYESGWSADGGGVANDRNADRQQYGVGDLQTFTAATRQCLEDVKGRGLRRWWDPGIGGMNVGFDTDPDEDVLNVSDTGFGLDGSNGDDKYIKLNGTTNAIWYDRTGIALWARIGGTEEMRLRQNGMNIADGLVVGDTSTTPTGGGAIYVTGSGGISINAGAPQAGNLSIFDINYKLGVSGDKMQTTYDASSWFEYDRSAHWYAWYVDGWSYLSINVADSGTNPRSVDIDLLGLTDCRLQSNGDDPRLQWASGDYVEYDVSANIWSWYIGTSEEMSLTASGLEVTNGLVVGFAGTPVNDEIQVGDANFGLAFDSTPAIRFDSDAWMHYNRVSDYFIWRIAGTYELYVDNSYLSPYSDYGLDLGAAANRWNVIYSSYNMVYAIHSDPIVSRFERSQKNSITARAAISASGSVHGGSWNVDTVSGSGGSYDITFTENITSSTGTACCVVSCRLSLSTAYGAHSYWNQTTDELSVWTWRSTTGALTGQDFTFIIVGN